VSDDDDRPRRKKSWKELDAQRDRGGSAQPRRDPEQRSREKVEKSSAYKKYVNQLDKLFTPGGGQQLPASLKEKLGPTSEGSAKTKELTSELHAKADKAALSAYLAAGLALPEDPRLLVRLLDVPDAELLTRVLGALLQLVEGGQKPSRMLLIQKLDAIVLRLGSGEAVDLAKQIRAELG
jgi:hypothetical protein